LYVYTKISKEHAAYIIMGMINQHTIQNARRHIPENNLLECPPYEKPNLTIFLQAQELTFILIFLPSRFRKYFFIG